MLAVEIFQIEAEQKRQNSKSGKQEHRHRIVILQWIVYAFVTVLEARRRSAYGEQDQTDVLHPEYQRIGRSEITLVHYLGYRRPQGGGH